MATDLTNILEHPPVQVKCEAVNKDSSRKLYPCIYISSDGKGRIDFENRNTESGETVEHHAFIGLPNIAYEIDLLAKTYKVRDGEVGFDFERMGLKVIEVDQEEPDPHLFLITADLRPE